MMMEERSFVISAFSDEAGDTLSEQIAALTRNRLDGMEIRAVGKTNIADLTIHAAKEIKAALDAHGLRVYNVGSPAGKSDICCDFAPEIERFKHLLDIAHILEAQRLRIFSFYIPDGQHVHCRDEVMERLSRFSDLACGSGVLLCHENERGVYGEHAAQCLDIVQTLPEIRCVFDPANFLLAGENIRRAWEMLKSKVEYLHIKDALPDGKIVPAGSGEGQIPYILSEFTRQGGRHITLEPHLFAFSGLSSLEKKDSEIKVGGYKTQSDAFDTACRALRILIGKGEEA